MAITVAISAASPVVRAGLASIVGMAPDLRLAADPSDDPAAGPPRAEVRLVDLPAGEDIATLLPEGPEPEATAPAVVLLADPAEPSLAAAALGRAVRAILPRAASEAEILAAVRAAAVGLIVLHPAFADARPGPAGRALESGGEPPPTQRLTAREVEVLAMLAGGASNKLIARRLGISDHTVKFHLSSIFSKLGAASRTEAVTLGARLGLILL